MAVGRIHYKTEEEISLIRQSSLLVGKTLGEVAKAVRPGVSTLELNRLAESFIRDHGGVPGFLGYNGFPATLCVSPNEVVVHGLPSHKELQEGDILSVDCGVLMNGYYGDSAYTFPIGEVDEEVRQLLVQTYKALFLGIEKAVAGNRLGDIGHAIQSHVESFGYTVVRELVGHGLGSHLHEPPDVLNYGRPGTGMKLMEGLVLCIEPMINLGRRSVLQERDGWTIRTADRKPSAHYELTVVVRKGEPEFLSTFEYIEESIGLIA